ncbi:50S ribosomal protein L17 [Marinithermus hydrothermalis]|uniref:Large ribosomal subunit protein bL17 n=1 Tax=Marinithermus hydrothermalis (strain DSM 14884 / JCM 11576 / T1) TaxID=869210 RepID=F2NMP8_MARHT|nr:50S ribosomal protein L17 [Marinithermus hydrothermalis]AEB12432.1 50S ribosomal protein L17 [Marinithermus hydrothermalis DSM 14884]
MRHLKSGRKLGRHSSHRLALYRNQATALLRHGRITTTVPKAKELRGFVEHLINVAKRGDLAARRRVIRDIHDLTVVRKLFDDIAPKYADRPGGYTRILKLAERRKGDGTQLAIIELVD